MIQKKIVAIAAIVDSELGLNLEPITIEDLNRFIKVDGKVITVFPIDGLFLKDGEIVDKDEWKQHIIIDGEPGKGMTQPKVENIHGVELVFDGE